MKLKQVVARLNSLANHEKVSFKAQKFGINPNNSLGIYHKDLKILAKEIGQDNDLAIELFETNIYEARLLCSKIYNPEFITKHQMDDWVKTFTTWEICDSFCMGFFAKSQFALEKAMQWSNHESEFTKRAGFVIMAAYGFANKKADNEIFEQFFEPIMQQSDDDRIYVKKAVNWALRNIGKRNIDLNKKVIKLAYKILARDSKSAKWIAKNALKEIEEYTKFLDYPRDIYRRES